MHLSISDEDELTEYLPVDNKLLPAWFTERMMSDSWSFGLLMITGDVIAIESIRKITQDANGNIWLDAQLLEHEPFVDNVNGHRILISPTSRTGITINAAHVVAAFELADT